MQDYTEQYKEIIMPIILNYVPYAKIILYGSRARKDAHEGSDIDFHTLSERMQQEILKDGVVWQK